MITKFARLEFELFTKPSKSDFLRVHQSWFLCGPLFCCLSADSIAAFGNSDGDLQMLQWTTSGKGKRFGLIVHHTDAEREWAYDRHSHIGRLDKALIEAKENGWTVMDMKKDWKRIFPILKTGND